MGLSPGAGLALALLAAAGNNVGKGVQKAATRALPQLSLARPDVVRAYLSSGAWLAGVALDIGGGAAMLGALASAPVSLVQPVAAFGLVLLAAFSHFVLGERLGPGQWRGAAVATLGIVLMGLAAAGGGGGLAGASAAGGSGSAAAGVPAAAAGGAAAVMAARAGGGAGLAAVGAAGPAAATPALSAAGAAAGVAAAAAVVPAPATEQQPPATGALPVPPPSAVAARPAGVPPAGGRAGEGLAATQAPAGGAAAAAAQGAAVASPLRTLAVFCALLGLLAAEVLWRLRRERDAAVRRKRLGSAESAAAAAAAAVAASPGDAAAYGIEAGCCFGFSAAAARTGFQLAQRLGWPLVPAGIAASVGLSSSGFVLQTRGFKHGPALVVCTTAAAASIVAGVVVGLLALAEPLPASRWRRLLLLAAWAATLCGVAAMAGGDGDAGITAAAAPLLESAAGALRAALLLLPHDVRRHALIRRLLAWLGARGGLDGGPGLPTRGSATGAAAAAAAAGAGASAAGGAANGGDGGSVANFAGVLAPLGGARRL